MSTYTVKLAQAPKHDLDPFREKEGSFRIQILDECGEVLSTPLRGVTKHDALIALRAIQDSFQTGLTAARSEIGRNTDTPAEAARAYKLDRVYTDISTSLED